MFEISQGFKPESWLRKKDFVLTEPAEGFASIPFGFEMQVCLGRRIAKLELHLLFARIVQQFDISHLPDAENVVFFSCDVAVPERA